MNPLPHNAQDLTAWLRNRHPKVLEEYELEEDTKWEEKINGAFSGIPNTRPQNTITRISYLKPGGQAYKFEEFRNPPPEKVQYIPTDDDYGNLIYVAEEMGLEEAVINEMREVKNKMRNGV